MDREAMKMQGKNSVRIKKALAAGVIGLTALGAVGLAPVIADAQDAPTQEEREARRAERQAEREMRQAEKSAFVTDVLGMTIDEFKAAREDGQSLADIAAAQDVPLETVIAAIVDAKTADIQEHVGDRLTQAEADEKIAALEAKVTESVNEAPGERGEGKGHRGKRGRR